ncbi:MAG: pyruvate kinase, partial [Rhodospirillales bacterium]|nr:pyruvate kinase [Rhodospirillales bacterium]
TYDNHEKLYGIIRDLEKDRERPIGIMMDLQGPKIRLSRFGDGPIQLAEGDEFGLALGREPGNQLGASISSPEIFQALEPGIELLIDDGKIRLKVEECDPNGAATRVIAGGPVSDHKGVNLPGAMLPISSITSKDKEDLDFGLKLGVDWVALSFVQKREDVSEARERIGNRAGILVKLEKPVAIDHLDGIVDLADAVMVARGDLGVEAPPEDVPGLQKKIIRHARREGKPVVVATQMLESMINAPVPTRAEASDVATAVFDGADAVMLSAETAAGDYPLEAVTMMDRIIDKVERDPLYRQMIEAERRPPEATDADAITSAAGQIADTISAAAIVTFTMTGSTSLRAARERPVVPILGLTPKLETARRLVLTWGVHPVHTDDIDGFVDMLTKAAHAASAHEFAIAGQRIVVTAGAPFGTPGTTNFLRIAAI